MPNTFDAMLAFQAFAELDEPTEDDYQALAKLVAELPEEQRPHYDWALAEVAARMGREPDA